MITQVNDRVWTIAAKFKVFGLIELNGRCTIIRCNDGSLWVHSPVRMVCLGQKSINRYSQIFSSAQLASSLIRRRMVKSYPEAQVYAPQGLRRKQPNLSIDHTLSKTESYAWSDEIEHVFLAGMPAVNEFIFYDRVSQTVLITDLCFYFRSYRLYKFYLN